MAGPVGGRWKNPPQLRLANVAIALTMSARENQMKSLSRGEPAGTSLDYAAKTYLINPRTFFGRRATSASEIPKLSAISDAGFADSHLDIEISSNPGLLNRMTRLIVLCTR